MTPQQRVYINAVIDKKFAELVQPLINESQALILENKQLAALVETLKIRVEAFESNFTDDKRYTLTRAKIVAFLKREGIN